MKELVEYLVKSLVDNVDAVRITEIEGEQTTVVEVRVAPEDIGKIIGRQGRTAKALRTIVSAASNKLKKRTMLEILE